MAHSDPAPAPTLAFQVYGGPHPDAGTVRAAVREGLKVDDLETVRDELGLTSRDVDRLLGVSAHALDPMEGLASDASDRLARLVDLADLAADVLGRENVGRWLHHPMPTLDGERPIDWLDTDAGTRKVRSLLSAIEWGGGF